MADRVIDVLRQQPRRWFRIPEAAIAASLPETTARARVRALELFGVAAVDRSRRVFRVRLVGSR